jgi:hypothetical protein
MRRSLVRNPYRLLLALSVAVLAASKQRVSMSRVRRLLPTGLSERALDPYCAR